MRYRSNNARKLLHTRKLSDRSPFRKQKCTNGRFYALLRSFMEEFINARYEVTWGIQPSRDACKLLRCAACFTPQPSGCSGRRRMQSSGDDHPTARRCVQSPVPAESLGSPVPGPFGGLRSRLRNAFPESAMLLQSSGSWEGPVEYLIESVEVDWRRPGRTARPGAKELLSYGPANPSRVGLP
jgi:hypothetical protein